MRLARFARILSWLTVDRPGIETGVAVGAAVIAGPAALLGFGLDSGIEALASVSLSGGSPESAWPATLLSAARSGWSRSASACWPPASRSRPSAPWAAPAAPNPASPGSCSPRAPLSWSPSLGWPSGAWLPAGIGRYRRGGNPEPAVRISRRRSAGWAAGGRAVRRVVAARRRRARHRGLGRAGLWVRLPARSPQPAVHLPAELRGEVAGLEAPPAPAHQRAQVRHGSQLKSGPRKIPRSRWRGFPPQARGTLQPQVPPGRAHDPPARPASCSRPNLRVILAQCGWGGTLAR
jgi:hypothetical protein